MILWILMALIAVAGWMLGGWLAWLLIPYRQGLPFNWRALVALGIYYRWLRRTVVEQLIKHVRTYL